MRYILALAVCASFFAQLCAAPFAAAQSSDAPPEMGLVRYMHTYPVVYGGLVQFRTALNENLGHTFDIPKSHATLSRNLVFDTRASLMYPTDKPHVEPGDRRMDEGIETIDTTYIEFDSGRYTEFRIADWERPSLVVDERPLIPWQLSGEEREYLGFRVVKATAEIDEAVIEAWFAPEIPIPAGPGLFGGLPGLILLLTNTSAGEAYAAEEVELGIQPRPIVPPTRGSTITDKQYHRIKARILGEYKRDYEERLEAHIRTRLALGRQD